MVFQKLFEGRDFDRSSLQSARQTGIMDDLSVPEVNAVVRDEPSWRQQMIADAQSRARAVHRWTFRQRTLLQHLHRRARVSAASSGRGFADGQACVGGACRIDPQRLSERGDKGKKLPTPSVNLPSRRGNSKRPLYVKASNGYKTVSDERTLTAPDAHINPLYARRCISVF
jgi:hypothetical protein